MEYTTSKVVLNTFNNTDSFFENEGTANTTRKALASTFYNLTKKVRRTTKITENKIILETFNDSNNNRMGYKTEPIINNQ